MAVEHGDELVPQHLGSLHHLLSVVSGLIVVHLRGDQDVILTHGQEVIQSDNVIHGISQDPDLVLPGAPEHVHVVLGHLAPWSAGQQTQAALMTWGQRFWV